MKYLCVALLFSLAACVRVILIFVNKFFFFNIIFVQQAGMTMEEAMEMFKSASETCKGQTNASDGKKKELVKVW